MVSAPHGWQDSVQMKKLLYHVGYTKDPCLLRVHRLLSFLLDQEQDTRHSEHLWRRAAQSAREPTAPILLFFGCRNEDDDFLYRDFWLHHAQDNRVLSQKEGGGFFAAFSRDQPEKVYVQHKIREQSAKVLNMLCSGAAIYVAGSSTKMPADVRAALEEVVREKGVKDASGWLRKLERAGKFNIETWS